MILFTIHIFLLLSIFIFFGILKLKRNLQNKLTANKSASSLAVIIPFRNEEHNLPELLRSLKQQVVLPQQIIFVDDHSTDASLSLVKEQAHYFEACKILQLNAGDFGKKVAIRKAIAEAKSEFILTIDADVQLPTNFFQSIQFNSSLEMLIQPVEMVGKTGLGRYFSLEYNFFNAYNYLISIIRTVNASGANLLVKKKSFKDYDSYPSHSCLSSGDDYFLLKDFLNNNAQVEVVVNKNLKVFTNSVDNIADYLSQRLRWLSKTHSNRQLGDYILGLFLFYYFVIHSVFLLLALIHLEWVVFFGLFSLHFLIDLFVMHNYSKRIDSSFSIFQLMGFQIVHPLLLIFLFVTSLIFKPNWKERTISSK